MKRKEEASEYLVAVTVGLAALTSSVIVHVHMCMGERQDLESSSVESPITIQHINSFLSTLRSRALYQF